MSAPTDSVRQPWRSTWLGVLAGFFGVVLFLSGLAALLVALGFLYGDELGSGLLIMLAGLVVLGAAHGLIGVGRRLRARSADEAMAGDPRPPILYCRTFSADAQSSSLELDAEEELARAFAALGPVVAIGRPGDRLRVPGAARRYVAHADWQAEVRQLMDRAQLIIFVAGDSPGLLWELETALASVPPNRLVILPPPDAAAWERFRARVDVLALPVDIQGADMVCFDTAGQPRLLWRMNQQRPWWEDAALIRRLLFKSSL